MSTESSAYRADESAKPFAFKSGHTIDVAMAVAMRPHAKKLLADEATTPGLRRTIVMTPVITGFAGPGLSASLCTTGGQHAIWLRIVTIGLPFPNRDKFNPQI